MIISSEFPPGPGGIGNHAFSLSKSLSNMGHSVSVLSDADYVRTEDVHDFDKKQLNIAIYRVWRSGFKTYVNRFLKARSIIKKEKIELVIFSGKFSLWLCGILSLLNYSFKSIGVLHGSEVKMNGKIKRTFTNWCIKRLDILLPVSKFTHGSLNKSLQKRPYQIIENGIDLSEMASLNQDHIINKSMFHGKPSLLTVGNVTPRKGQQRVIKAMPNLLKRYPDLHYHIVGLPTYKSEFEELARELGVLDHTTFHGRLPKREDLSVAYNSVDCFVILSENQADGDVEGFGIVVLEANYFALPVIGAEGCGIADAIDDGYNGYLVDGNNSEQITDKLEEVLVNKKVLQHNAQHWAVNHDWNHIGLKYNEVILQLLS